jgi:hypothetical protein
VSEPSAVQTGKVWRMRRDAVDRTQQDLSCMTVSYSVGLLAFKYVISVPNSHSGLV